MSTSKSSDGFGQFFDAVGSIFSAVVDSVTADMAVKKRTFQISSDSTELDMVVTYESGRTEVIPFIRKDAIKPPRIVTVHSAPKPRPCTLWTPADLCEDRNCRQHSEVPVKDRPRTLDF